MSEIEMDTEIEVRTLTGESINVSISPNNSIHQLKLLLKQTFPPATCSPNFHLFLKGTKLSLQSKITSISISDGDFIVLVPFTRKDKQQAVETSVNDKDFGKNDECSTSKFADSAWSDMMQDLTLLQERQIDGNEKQPDVEFGRTELNVQKEGVKGLFDEGMNELLDVLEKCDGDELGEERCGKFLQVLELVNCLSDSKTWDCMLRKANTGSSGIGFGVESSCLCICPSWLKVIQFIDQETKGRRSNNAIVILKSKSDLTCPLKGKKKMFTARVVSTMRKREGAFKTDLCATVTSFMEQKGNKIIKSCSLKDLLLHINDGNHNETKCDAKRTRRSLSEPSFYLSLEEQCNETNSLLPTEMVQHLRAGLGSQGQMVHVEEIKGRIANFVEIPGYLSERMQSALKSSGVLKLYSHQAESIEASLAGKSVVISTMTSSGKSLCYNLPVLEVLSQDLSACALYLFPTKALAQDQLRALLSMTQGFDVGLDIGNMMEILLRKIDYGCVITLDC